MHVKVALFLSLFCMVVLPCTSAFSWSTVDKIVSKSQEISEHSAEFHEWLHGALEILNDRQRTEGWQHFFTESSNDVRHYGYMLHFMDDVDRLIEKLSSMDCDNKMIFLRPESEPRGNMYTAVLKDSNLLAATFSLGSQKLLEQWYLRLKETESGMRRFGSRIYFECPKALPPTLTLYVGNTAIDITELEVSKGIKVVQKISDTYREAHKDSLTVKAIDQFVTKRNASLVAAVTE